MTQSRGQILLNPEVISNAATDGGAVILFEGSTNGENAITFKAPDAVTADYTFTLPDGTGTSGQALTTNGSGVTSWTTVTAASGGASGQFQYNDGASGFAGLSTMTTDGTDITITGGAISTNSTIAIRDASFAATFQSPTYTADTTYTLPVQGTASAGAALIAASGSTVGSTILEWGTPSGTNQDPGGATGDVQFRGATGLFTGEAAFNYDITTDILSVPTLQATNIRVTGNTISSTNTDGSINLDANGTGDVILSGGTDLIFNGSTAGTATIAAPATISPNYSLTLPTAGPADDRSVLQFQADGTGEFVDNTKTLNFVMDSGASATPIAAGVRGEVYMDRAYTITAWRLIASAAGAFSINVDQATPNFTTVTAASTYTTVISAAALAAGEFRGETTGLSISVAAGDSLRFDIQNAGTQEVVTMALTMRPV